MDHLTQLSSMNQGKLKVSFISFVQHTAQCNPGLHQGLLGGVTTMKIATFFLIVSYP